MKKFLKLPAIIGKALLHIVIIIIYAMLALFMPKAAAAAVNEANAGDTLRVRTITKRFG